MNKHNKKWEINHLSLPLDNNLQYPTVEFSISQIQLERWRAEMKCKETLRCWFSPIIKFVFALVNINHHRWLCLLVCFNLSGYSVHTIGFKTNWVGHLIISLRQSESNLVRKHKPLWLHLICFGANKSGNRCTGEATSRPLPKTDCCPCEFTFLEELQCLRILNVTAGISSGKRQN